MPQRSLTSPPGIGSRPGRALLIAVAGAALCTFSTPRTLGEELDLGEALGDLGDPTEASGTESLEDSLFAQEREAERQRDLPRLRCSHFTEVWRWQRGTPWKKASVPGYQQYASTSNAYPPRQFATPASTEPVSTVVAVPEKGDYRLWLGYVAKPDEARRVALTLTGANQGEFPFGEARLPRQSGKALERKFPLRFESDLERTSPLTSPTVVWEYRDVSLEAGATGLSLQARPGSAQVDSVFLTLSKTLVPNKTIQDHASENTLTRTWYRFRVVDPEPEAETVTVSCFVRYALSWLSHPGSETRDWFGKMAPRAADGSPNLPAGEWSNWIDWTDQAMSNHRRGHGIVYATLEGCERGFLEAQ